MWQPSSLECSKEKDLSVMSGFDKKLTPTVDVHFEAQKGKRGSVVDENVNASYCGEQWSLKERCDNRQNSHDALTSLPSALYQNLGDDLGIISSHEEKKYRRHRACNQQAPFSTSSALKQNSSPCEALSAQHMESSLVTDSTMRAWIWSRTEENPLFESQIREYPKAMCEVPISIILNDVRNLAVRRVAAGLEPNMSGAALIRNRSVEIWEPAWLILSRGILWSGAMGPYGPHNFHRLAWVKNDCNLSCCNDEAPLFTLMWEGSDENDEDEVLPQHILKFPSGVHIALNSVQALLEWASVLQQGAWLERGLYCEKTTSQLPEPLGSCQWLKNHFEKRFIK